MKQDKAPPSERLALSFRQLATASEELSIAAKDLNKTISTVEAALGTLNLGVSAWHKVAVHTDRENGSFWNRDIGYSKVGREWGIFLRRQWGNEFDEESGGEEVWRFAEAPRWMCIEAAGKIPELLEELVARTLATTTALKNRKAQTEEIAAVLTTLADEIVAERANVGVHK
jgi:hypothetical protein